MDARDRLVAIGEIVRPHGLRGEVRVAPMTDDPRRFERLTACVVWNPARDERLECRITAVRRQGDVVFVTLAGYDSPEAARTLAGRLIAIPVSEALPPGPGRFYPWQLEGSRVLTEDGREVGRVVRVEQSPGQDLWVVEDGGREHLIPAVPAIVIDVDLAARRVVIRPPEGLLDL
jgi:16S rRNA processing protein RimM